jgi:hypothetical protein
LSVLLKADSAGPARSFGQATIRFFWKSGY